MPSSKTIVEAAGGKGPRVAFGLRCKVYAKNSLPQDYDVSIVGAGVEFIFRVGDPETDGDDNLSIQSGQSQQFAESDPARCVRKLKGVVKYERNRTGDIGVAEAESEEVPAGECGAEWTMELAPALTVPETIKDEGPRLRLIVSKFA